MPCSLLGHGRRGRGSGLRGPTSSRRVLTPWGQLDLRCFTPQSSSAGLACSCTHVCCGPFSPFPIPGAPQPTVCYFWGGVGVPLLGGHQEQSSKIGLWSVAGSQGGFCAPGHLPPGRLVASEDCPLWWGALHGMSPGGARLHPTSGVPGDVECSEDRGHLCAHV